jgi:hypothetical protein
MRQELDYTEILDVPFAYSSNRETILGHYRTGGLGSFTPNSMGAT